MIRGYRKTAFRTNNFWKRFDEQQLPVTGNCRTNIFLENLVSLKINSFWNCFSLYIRSAAKKEDIVISENYPTSLPHNWRKNDPIWRKYSQEEVLKIA